MEKYIYDTHLSHCCYIHGCKYGDKDCPVETGKVKKIGCEICELEEEGYDDSLEISLKPDIVPTEIKVKKLHSDTILPQRAHSSDVGYDVVAVEDGKVSSDYNFIEYDVGFSLEIPAGYHVQIFPRSSISKYDMALANSVAIIDQDYRGPIKLRFRIFKCVKDAKIYKKGDKIALMILVKTQSLPFIFSDEINETKRGEGGFGSTGS